MTISNSGRPTLTRRNFIGAAGAAVAGAAIMPYAPALAQTTRRDLRVGVFGGDFGNLSPVVRWDIQAGLPMQNIFDTLVRTDFANRKIVPWLAEDWSNPDALTWRIKLREGVMWHHDFGEMTAEDVAYTWNYHIESKSFQVGIALFAVDTIKVEDKYVLEVKTKTPFGAFPGVTMGYGGMIVSADAHQEMGDQAYSAAPIGQGPYMLESARGNELALVRNDKYWREGFPKMDKLFYRAIPDSSVRLQALARGEVDFMTHPDPKEIGDFDKSSDYTVTRTPGWNWDFQQFNLRLDPSSPMQNKLVRQAISYAIDREAIVNEIYSGEATITDNQIPPGYLGHRESLMKYPKNGDLAKAKELMAQAGVSGMEIEVNTSDKDWLRRELELVAAMVSQIGITYKIHNLDVGGFNSMWFAKTYPNNLEDVTIVAPDPDATSWWHLHSNGSTSGYTNPVMDKLLDDARQEIDTTKRESLYHQVVDLTVEECPMVFHCNVNYVHIFNKDLKGFSPTPQEFVEQHDATEWVS